MSHVNRSYDVTIWNGITTWTLMTVLKTWAMKKRGGRARERVHTSPSHHHSILQSHHHHSTSSKLSANQRRASWRHLERWHALKEGEKEIGARERAKVLPKSDNECLASATNETTSEGWSTVSSKNWASQLRRNNHNKLCLSRLNARTRVAD